jgi:cytochrome c-type biogenesis protein CcmH/NrfF
VKRLLLILAIALLAPVTAGASEQRPTQAELERELICPVCKPATLDQSDSEIARRMKREIARRIAAGDTKSEIKDYLVAQFGEQVLAAPPRSGFNWLAWVLPFAGLGLGAAAVAFAAWRWSRSREPAVELPAEAQNGRPRLDPELERRLEDELARFE